MQKEKEILLKMLNKILEDANLISLNTKIDLDSNLISVKFSVLCEDNDISENSYEIFKDTSHIDQNKACKETLISGFTENEVEFLREQYKAYQIQNDFGLSLYKEDQDDLI
jgi:hypothetical protein